MKFYIDTEFIEDGKTIDLISIGIVAEDGRQFYAESTDADLSRASDWVTENVVAHLWSRQSDKRDANRWSRDGGEGGLMSRAVIAGDLRRFCGAAPEFWGYYCDYDWVLLCQLFGTMMDLPEGWPMYCHDLRQSLDGEGLQHVTQPDDMPHNALSDAQWIADTHKTFSDGKLVSV